MHKGGRPTPEQAGLHLDHREALWNKLCQMDEGTVFQWDTVLDGMPEGARDDLAAMVGYDLLSIHKDWYTAVREGAYVRMMPNPIKVVESWCAVQGWEQPTLFGDWAAHKMGLYLWEPIAGYRLRTRTPNVHSTLVLGHARIRIVSCPSWLEGDTDVLDTVRALVDMPHKTLAVDLKRWLAKGEGNGALLDAALVHLAGVEDSLWDRAHPDARGWKPADVLRSVAAARR
jgi:hypothetical protein